MSHTPNSDAEREKMIELLRILRLTDLEPTTIIEHYFPMLHFKCEYRWVSSMQKNWYVTCEVHYRSQNERYYGSGESLTLDVAVKSAVKNIECTPLHLMYKSNLEVVKEEYQRVFDLLMIIVDRHGGHENVRQEDRDKAKTNRLYMNFVHDVSEPFHGDNLDIVVRHDYCHWCKSKQCHGECATKKATTPTE